MSVRTKRITYKTFESAHTIHLTFIKLNSLVNDYFFDTFPEFFHNAYHLFSVYNYIIYFCINRDISWGNIYLNEINPLDSFHLLWYIIDNANAEKYRCRLK